MKKMLVLVCLLFITGCSSTLTCTKEQKEEYVTMNQEIKINFKGKKVKSAEFIVDAELKTEYTDSSDYFAELLRTQFSNFQELYGVDLEVKQTKTGAKLIMKMNKESFNNIYGSSSQNIDKDNIKRNFEDNGYACK